MRLDKYISNIGLATRKETSKLAKKGFIKVNNNIVKQSDFKIKENDIIDFDGKKIEVIFDVCIALHKPSGYVSSDIEEGNYFSYKKLLEDCLYKGMVNIAGRLDIDTEGLLILLSDGKKIHQIISPKKQKEKIYFVELEKNISENDIQKLENGLEIDDYTTAPARAVIVDNNIEELKKFGNFKDTTLNQIPLDRKYAILLAITEGKFHQIKKMAHKINNKVVYLKRLKVGEYELEDLELGKWKIIGN